MDLDEMFQDIEDEFIKKKLIESIGGENHYVWIKR